MSKYLYKQKKKLSVNQLKTTTTKCWCWYLPPFLLTRISLAQTHRSSQDGEGLSTSALTLYLCAHDNLRFIGHKKGLWIGALTVQLPILSLWYLQPQYRWPKAQKKDIQSKNQLKTQFCWNTPNYSTNERNPWSRVTMKSRLYLL